VAENLQEGSAPTKRALRIARDVGVVRQDELAAALRERGHKVSQVGLSNRELGITPLEPELAFEIREMLIAIVEARLKAMRELLS
jgi:hypothetical protein